MKYVIGLTGCVIVGAAVTGCASHNYDFALLPEDSSRIEHLADDLGSLSDSDRDDDALYDVSVIPLVHSRLHVFTESDGDDAPAGFVEAEIESSFPLFGFVDGEVSHYDENHQLITRHEFDSSLWGAFRNHREIVTTQVGTRERTRHTFLWLFGWFGDEQWHLGTESELSVAGHQ